MSKFGTYVQEAYDELLHKVTWPTTTELQKSTVMVIIGLIVISLITFGMDAVSKKLLELIYSLG